MEQARESLEKGRELEPERIIHNWMLAWLRIGQKKPGSAEATHLETIAEMDAAHYLAFIYRGVALHLRGNHELALNEINQAIGMEPDADDAYFWQGVILASLKRDEEAMAAIHKALELELPPVLLTPLQWFKEDRADFYEKYALPLLSE